jgi:hypothetical protein
LWQYCTPDKAFFNTTGHAMVTDSINNYSVPDTSIFELRYKENYPMMSYYIEITHKYDFDVYNAGGFISFSLDSGKTWGSIDNYLNNINAFCTEYAQFFASNSYLKSDSLTDGTPCFTGTTTEWKKTFLEFIFYLPVKTEPVDCYNIRTVWTRFTFVSLPTTQQENGWAIKKLKWGLLNLGGSVNEIKLADELYFQNPVQDKLILNTNNNEHFTKILITDISGKEILKMNYSKEISLENLQSGLYFLYLTDRNEKTVYSKFIKE